MPYHIHNCTTDADLADMKWRISRMRYEIKDLFVTTLVLFVLFLALTCAVIFLHHKLAKLEQSLISPKVSTMSGLISKYQVRDAAGQPLDGGCFVLRPFNADGSIRDHAACIALMAYMRYLPDSEQELRKDLKDWLSMPDLHAATTGLNQPPVVE